MRPSWRGFCLWVLLGFPEQRSFDTDGDAMVAEPVQEGVDHVLGFQQDNPSNALPIMKLLEKAGHTVTLAENGQQA